MRHALQTFDFEPLDVGPGPLGPGPPPGSGGVSGGDRGAVEEPGGLPRGGAGSIQAASPDPGDPALVERFRRALTEEAADAPHDAGQQGMLFDKEIYDDLDRLDELIDDSRTARRAAAPVAASSPGICGPTRRCGRSWIGWRATARRPASVTG